MELDPTVKTAIENIIQQSVKNERHSIPIEENPEMFWVTTKQWNNVYLVLLIGKRIYCVPEGCTLNSKLTLSGRID